MSGSRGPTQIHTRGLCHWASEPAGHLGAESPSRRTARPASARKTSSPCPHWLRRLSQKTHHVNAVSRHRRVPPFASSRRPLTHALAHLQWQEPPRFLSTQAQPAGLYAEFHAKQDSLTINRPEVLLLRNQLHATRDRVKSYRMKLEDSPLESPAS